MNVFEKIREKVKDYFKDKIAEDKWDMIDFNADISNIVYQVEQEYNHGWIPCSERLPDKYDEYLCVNKYGSYILGYPYRNKADKDLIMVETENEIMLEVIAWQPLPQPYKERDTNGN